MHRYEQWDDDLRRTVWYCAVSCSICGTTGRALRYLDPRLYEMTARRARRTAKRKGWGLEPDVLRDSCPGCWARAEEKRNRGHGGRP